MEPLPSWVSSDVIPGYLAMTSLKPATRSMHDLAVERWRIATLAFGLIAARASAASLPAPMLSLMTWQRTILGSLIGIDDDHGHVLPLRLDQAAANALPVHRVEGKRRPGFAGECQRDRCAA